MVVMLGSSPGWSPGCCGSWGERVAFRSLAKGTVKRSSVPACAAPSPGTRLHTGPHLRSILDCLTKTRGPTVAAPPLAGWEKAHSAGRMPGWLGIGHCLNVPGRMPVCPWAAFPSDRLSRPGNPKPKGLRRKDRIDRSFGRAHLCFI